MRTIQLPQVGEVQLRKSSKAKRVILKIDSRGTPIVTIPSYTPYIIAEKFARKHEAWFIAHTPTEKKRLIVAGQLIANIYTVYFKVDLTKDTLRSRVDKNSITIYHPATASVFDQIVQKEAQKACTRAVKRVAEAQLPTALHALAEYHSYHYTEVHVKNMKTRWGSCSSTGVINLNIWLVQLPEELVKYVLCHELTHLHHPHHQTAFWDELQTLIPDCKQRRAELKKFQPDLVV